MLFYKKMLKNIAERVKKYITGWALRMHLRRKSAKSENLIFFLFFFLFSDKT